MVFSSSPRLDEKKVKARNQSEDLPDENQTEDGESQDQTLLEDLPIEILIEILKYCSQRDLHRNVALVII
jgi:hypothetical protein